MTTEIATGGTRISQFSVRIGDYVRIMSHMIQRRYSDQWWKVTDIKGKRLSLINADGAVASFTPSQYDRVIRHPYSQKQARS